MVRDHQLLYQNHGLQIKFVLEVEEEEGHLLHLLLPIQPLLTEQLLCVRVNWDKESLVL
jgi:hypothetical protein